MRAMQFLRTTALLFCMQLSASALFAQAANRLAEGIASSAMAELKGSTHPLALSKNDAGRMSAQTRLEGMTLHFALTDTQQAELNTLLIAQQTPGSSYYHRWLSPAEFAARFGLSDSDIEQVKSWLTQQGFTVNRVANSRMSINFSGNVAQVESAFGTTMRYYTVGGTKHFANASDLKIPSALSGVVSAVGNLDDFKPKPHLRLHKDFTSSASGTHYMTPLDVATIYDVNAAYNNGYTGDGQSIVVVGQSAVDTTDVQNFQKALGWTSYNLPTTVLVPNTGSSEIVSGDEAESDLDLEYTSGIAKGAKIYFVYTGNSSNSSGVFDSLEYAIDNRLGTVISVSYGSCEAYGWSTTEIASYETALAEGAAQGQSIIVSSGDDGAEGCYYLYEDSGSQYSSYASKLSVSYPASSAYATAVGGTEFSSANSTSSTYWNSASSSDVVSTAKSYIPEIVWNDSSSSDLSSTGGGTSIYVTRPSWQTGVTGISTATDYSKGYRLVPDVSLASSPSYTGYLYCSSDSETEITGSCSNGFRDTNSKYLTVAGGTSFAAPIFAGMVAILGQKLNANGLGLVNSTLYSLASNTTTYASVFHDITSGNNACPTSVSLCNSSYSTDYTATTGYDEATGLGSVDFYNLVSAWPTTSSASLAGSTTTLSAATSSPSSGASDAITITVASGSSSSTVTPTGTLALYVDGTEVSSALALSSGAASYSFSSTTSGAHTITAEYSGDTNYAASSGSVVVTVSGSSTTAKSGSFSLSLSSSTVTISSSGGSATSTVTVTPANSYTGTVNFTLATTSSALQNKACYAISSAKVSSSSAVTSVLTVYYGSSYCSNASSSATGTGLRQFKLASSSSAAAVRSVQTMQWAGFGGLGLLLSGLIGWRFRRVRGWMCLLALASLGISLSGCGSKTSSSSSSSGSSSSTSTSYALTLTGTDSTSSSITSTASLTLTVD